MEIINKDALIASLLEERENAWTGLSTHCCGGGHCCVSPD
jgi:hypothetical protein